MNIDKESFAILDKLELPVKPVAVGFFQYKPPEGVPKSKGKVRFCEMPKIARDQGPFYFDREDHECDAAKHVLGQGEAPPAYLSGVYAKELKGYGTASAGRRPYYTTTVLHRNSTDYVACSTLDKLSFEPDVLIIGAKTKQAATIMHARSWTTGEPAGGKVTFSMACSWIYIRPYVTGEINCIPADFSIGMRRSPVYPEGLIVISIPFELVPSILDSLREMPWTNPCHEPGGMDWKEQVRIEVGLGPSS